jgi:hypothetical protein
VLVGEWLVASVVVIKTKSSPEISKEEKRTKMIGLFSVPLTWKENA